MIRHAPTLLRLLRRPRWSAERLTSYQDAGVRRLVAHAYANVPYYRTLLDSVGLSPDTVRTVRDLERIPVSRKEDLLAAGTEAVVAHNFDRSKLIRTETSGSSGIPLTVYSTPDEVVFRRLLDLRGLMQIGVKPWHRIAFITPRTPRFPKTRRPLAFRARHISATLPTAALLDELDKLRPDVLWAYPSLVPVLMQERSGSLAAFCRSGILVTAAEKMDPSLRERLSTEEGIEHFDFYGSIEIGRIAAECPQHNGLHVNLDHVVLQPILDPESRPRTGEGGEFAITKLNGFAMPFIRYNLGDVLTLKPHSCACGSAFPLIGEVVGRRGDVLYLPSGRVLSPRGLIPCVRKLAAGHAFQIVQRSPERLSVMLEQRDPPLQADVQECVNRLSAIIGEEIAIEILPVENIRRQTGKQREFIGLQQRSARR